MEGSPLDIVIFAPLAPIFGVILFWFIQLLFIESQKYHLSRIKDKHEALIRFTNFLGIFFQTICHALGYTVTRSGISNFYISVDYGKVSPKKEKKGIFEWLSNAFLIIGPFFIPAILLLICTFFLINPNFKTSLPIELLETKYTFAGQMIYFGTNLYNYSEGFFRFLFTIDLFNPTHLGFLLLLIFLGMGIRPNYIGETKREKVDMIYDLKNIKNNILKSPIYIAILFSISYIFFYITLLLNQNWYISVFSLFGWLSIIAIASMIITHLLILLIKTCDDIKDAWKYVPLIVMFSSYIIIRICFSFIEFDSANSLSLLIMIISTILSMYILKKYKTNKFKTKRYMEPLTTLKKIKDDANAGSRRIIK